jgi:deazaflavin-dependent oxidoreductase (nitroreductase family)
VTGALDADVRQLLTGLAGEDVCHLRTVGRTTGQWHTVELWFCAEDGRVAFLSGGGEHADWVRNLRARPEADVVIRGRTLAGRASFPAGTDREQRVRELLASKYQRWSAGRPLSGWARESLPVEIVIERLVEG